MLYIDFGARTIKAAMPETDGQLRCSRLEIPPMLRGNTATMAVMIKAHVEENFPEAQHVQVAIKGRFGTARKVEVATKADRNALEGSAVAFMHDTQDQSGLAGHHAFTGPNTAWVFIEREKEVSCVALVYREGDTVVLGEVADEVLPNFLAPLLAKYGFDLVKWIVANPKRQ